MLVGYGGFPKDLFADAGLEAPDGRIMTTTHYLCLAFWIAAVSTDLLAGTWRELADQSPAASDVVSEADTDLAKDPEQLYWRRLDEIRSLQSFPSDAARGRVKKSHKIEGFDPTFHYTIVVPETYDPTQKTDLHIYLHGGVGISSNRISNRKINRLKRLRVEDSISVYPSAWSAAKWWYESQTKNIVRIINAVKDDYNVDENRVFLHGLSDGAGGVYYFASHLPTPFAGFVALVGSPHVLRPKHNVFGTTFAGNLVNKPIFAINTEDDHLFPAKSVEKLFEAVNSSGGDITFYAMPGDHFGMPWLSKRKNEYESFVADNSRNPYPDTLFWQIDEQSEFHRIHWLVVHDSQGGDTESAVVAEKNGNAVYLSSKNVAAVTLLISPDHFDLDENIQVWSNRELVFDARVMPDVRVLEKWFELDRDKSMLFASEILVETL
ncbi:MAG: hypothetical protein AAFY29_16785 [Pseudomonadota bacterium]